MQEKLMVILVELIELHSLLTTDEQDGELTQITRNLARVINDELREKDGRS